ncbi:MAG: ABC transporter substrate-binding protein, partial [Arenicellales bacterium]
AGSAQAQATIERFHDGLLAVMKQGDTLGFPGRVARLEPLVKETFSLEFMTRLIVGEKWQSLGEDRKDAVLSAFTDWVVATYANRFSSFDGEQFKIEGVSDGGRGTVVVNTEIVPSDDSPVSLGYRMLDGKVIDIYLNGSVSQLATWRSEFSSIIDKDGIDGLIDKLNQRTKKLATGTS